MDEGVQGAMAQDLFSLKGRATLVTGASGLILLTRKERLALPAAQ